MAISPAALEGVLSGVWAVHQGGQATGGLQRYRRRRPMSHIAFGVSRWWLFETALRRRFGSCGMSEGRRNVITADGGALLVLTVGAYRWSAPHQAILGSNYGYVGGAIAVASAHAQQERELRRMRDGQAKMYFLPLEIDSQSIIMALPSIGRGTPVQRWVRTEYAWPPSGL